MILLDKMAYTSPLRKYSPSLKTGFAVGTLLVCVGARSFLLSILVLALMGYFTVHFGKVSLSSYRKMMLAPATFLLLGTLAILFDITQNPSDLVSIPIGGVFLSISRYSLKETVRLIAVALSSVSCLYFLSSTTPMLDLIQVLKKIRLPWVLIELMMLIYRFIFVLGDIAVAILLSQESRLSTISKKKQLKAIGQMLSVLLVRAVSKANILYDAMESRCYNGRIEVLEEDVKATPKQKIALFLYLIVLISFAIFIRLLIERGI